MSETLDIKLMGKDYRVACSADERESLSTTVRFLDGKLKEIGDRTRSSGERLAVMAALNIAHELLALKNILEPTSAALESDSIQRMIDSIESKLDESLAKYETVS